MFCKYDILDAYYISQVRDFLPDELVTRQRVVINGDVVKSMYAWVR